MISQVHNSDYRIFLKFIVNVRWTAGVIHLVLSDLADTSICRSFVQKYVDRESRTVNRMQAGRDRVPKLNVEV
jgi:hypothetical protein